MTHEVFLSEKFGAVEGWGTLFEDIVVYEGEDIIHTATVESDPDFSLFAELISDGLDWWLCDRANYAGGLYGSSGHFGLESQRLLFADPDLPGPDLSGYVVESVTRILNVDFDSPGSDPAGDGQWTDYEITGVVEFYGHPVPEPAMLLPLLLLATLIKRG